MISLKIKGSGLNELYEKLVKISYESSWKIEVSEYDGESIEFQIPIERMKELGELLNPKTTEESNILFNEPYIPDDRWVIRSGLDFWSRTNAILDIRNRMDIGNQQQTKEENTMKSNSDEVKIKVIKIPQEDYDKLEGFDYLGIDEDRDSYFYNQPPELNEYCNCYNWTQTNSEYRSYSEYIDIRNKAVDQNEPCTTLFKFEPIKKGEFTKSMLETGMAVVTKSGSIKLVVGDRLIGQNKPGSISDWSELVDYTEYMIHNELSSETIVSVHKFKVCVFNWRLTPTITDVIWTRQEKSEEELKIEELEASAKQIQEQIKELKVVQSNKRD